jgi:hypothetical protein
VGHDCQSAVALAKPEIQGKIFRRTDSRLLSVAMQIVQYVAEIKKPDGERLPQFHEAGLDIAEVPVAVARAD